MKKLDTLITPAILVIALTVFLIGLSRARYSLNKPAPKQADIALPKVDERALESVRIRSQNGRFETEREVTGTRPNPFEHYTGYVAPAAPPEQTTTPSDTSLPTLPAELQNLGL